MKRQIDNRTHDDDCPQPKVAGHLTTDNSYPTFIFRLFTGNSLPQRVVFQNGNAI